MKLVRFILMLPLSLLACMLFSPRVLPTPIMGLPATATAPPLPAETFAKTLTETPTSLPAMTLSAADFTPILYRDNFSNYNEFRIIGGVQERAWLPAQAVADQVQFEQAYELYANGFAGVAVTKDNGAPPASPRCAERYIGTDFSTYVPHVIGVKQGWDVTYRPWREIAANTPVYYTAVADWLVSQGFALPAVQINRIVVVDLEGDGVDEVFISAAYFKDTSGHMAEQGDYSIVLLRKVVGGQVATVPVAADLYTNSAPEQVFPFTYSLVNLLDLNQDGILDLIVEASRWEGNGVILYQVNGTNVTEALRSICMQ